MKTLSLAGAALVFLVGVSVCAQPLIELDNILFEYDERLQTIVVRKRDSGEEFFRLGVNAIQVLNWSLAMGHSLKAGLSAKHTVLDPRMSSWLVSGRNGHEGMFLVSTAQVMCEPLANGNVEFLFPRPRDTPLKLLEGGKMMADSLQKELEWARKQGGGFLRIFVKNDAQIDASVCNWKEQHPAQPLDITAWLPTDKRIGELRGIQLFKYLYILDPARHEGRFEFRPTKKLERLVGEKLELKSWQKEAVLRLEDEARERGKVIACAMNLRDEEDAAHPFVREAFCFVVDADVLPRDLVNRVVEVRVKKGFRQFKYNKL